MNQQVLIEYAATTSPMLALKTRGADNLLMSLFLCLEMESEPDQMRSQELP